MQQRFAGQYAIVEANRTGVPQTVYQSGWDEWEYCASSAPEASSKHACVTWLPTYYHNQKRFVH